MMGTMRWDDVRFIVALALLSVPMRRGRRLSILGAFTDARRPSGKA